VTDNLLPPLDDFDLERLDESIRDYGVREPIVEDEYGKPIDGYHRKAIAAKYGLPCPARVVTGLTEPEKYELAIMLNAARRHLTIEQKRHIWKQRRARIEDALIANPTRSDRAIAEETGSTHPTVAAIRERLEENGNLSILERRGRGEPVEREPHAENMADHRNDVWMKVEVGYAAPSDETRRRGMDPYPQASDRLTWSSGQLYLIADAPTNDHEFAALLAEGMQRCQREAVHRPLKTFVRAAYA
jgi:hypothetical protein